MDTTSAQLLQTTHQLMELIEGAPFTTQDKHHYSQMLQSQGATPYVVKMIEQAVESSAIELDRKAQYVQSRMELLEEKLETGLQLADQHIKMGVKNNQEKKDGSLLASIRARINGVR